VKTLSLSEVKAKLSELVDEVESRDERIVITRKGRPAAVLISQDDLDSWQETLEITSDRALMTEIRRGIRQLQRGQTSAAIQSAELVVGLDELRESGWRILMRAHAAACRV